MVKEGDPLYRIEKGLFQAAVEQAQGALQISKAQHELAVKNRQRQEDLYAKNVTAGKALDEAIASEGEAKGAIMTNEANLQTAQINLGYTDIVAPTDRECKEAAKLSHSKQSSARHGCRRNSARPGKIARAVVYAGGGRHG